MSNRKEHRPLVCKITGNLDEETRDFIKPYAEKWKSKSLFQVILQYRASKQHHLFNFAQQVHFFNQKCVHNLRLINKPVHLDCIELKAQSSSWLAEIHPPVLKLPFRLDDIPYFDTTYMCDPIGNTTVSAETEENWDSPFKWRDNISSQIMTSLMGREEHPHSQHIKDDEADLIKTNADKLINLPYNRDPTEPVRKLSCALLIDELMSKSIMHKEESKIRSTRPKSPVTKKDKNHENIKSRPNTNSPGKTNPINPIAELKNLAKQNDSDDEPPFNFQAMLKKTSIKRESLKRALGKFQDGSRRGSMDFQDHKSKVKSREAEKYRRNDTKSPEMTTVNIAPGVTIKGLVADL